jgi:hypothetical protein
MHVGLLMVGLLGLSVMAHAEEAPDPRGIDPATECLKVEALAIDELTNFPENLTPESYPNNFQKEKNRFIFCFTTEQLDKYPKLKVIQPTTITNDSQYTIVFYGLTVNSSKFTEPVAAPTITLAGSGEIILQSLNAPDIRSAVVMMGRSTILSSSISCHAELMGPGMTISSNRNALSKVDIIGCPIGLGITGGRNVVERVRILRTVTAADQLGGWGVSISGSTNALKGIEISGYQGGVML